MTYGVNGAHALADLLPTDEELAALAELIEEIQAGELDALPGEDEAELAGYADVGQLVDLAYANEQQRQAEDATPLPRRSEDRTEWLLSRATRGTLTPGPMFRTPDPSHGCDGAIDEFGRCASRYHHSCMEPVRQSAATSTAEVAQRWRDTLLSTPSSADVALAGEDLLSPDDLFGPGTGPTDLETYQHMKAVLGIGGKADLPSQRAPSTLAHNLGVY